MILNNFYQIIKVLTNTPNENNTYPISLTDTSGNIFSTINGEAGVQIRNAFNTGWTMDGINDSIKIQLGVMQGEITPQTYDFTTKNENLTQTTQIVRNNESSVIDILSTITNDTEDRVSFNAVGLQLKTTYDENFRGKFLLTMQKKNISIAPYESIVLRAKVNY